MTENGTLSELSKREGECFVQKADKIIWIIRRKEKVSKKNNLYDEKK